MQVDKKRALAAVRLNGRLKAFVEHLDAETVAAWNLTEVEGTPEQQDTFITEYIDEVKTQTGTLWQRICGSVWTTVLSCCPLLELAFAGRPLDGNSDELLRLMLPEIQKLQMGQDMLLQKLQAQEAQVAQERAQAMQAAQTAGEACEHLRDDRLQSCCPQGMLLIAVHWQ